MTSVLSKISSYDHNNRRLDSIRHRLLEIGVQNALVSKVCVELTGDLVIYDPPRDSVPFAKVSWTLLNPSFTFSEEFRHLEYLQELPSKVFMSTPVQDRATQSKQFGRRREDQNPSVHQIE